MIDTDDPVGKGGGRLGEQDYETVLGTGDPEFAWLPAKDEGQSMSLNYTSGTTGNPKGVVYHHRGAYLNAIGNAITFGLQPSSVYQIGRASCRERVCQYV